MLSRGDSGGVARGKRLVPSRSQCAGGYSAGEMRQVGQALRAWRAAHPGIGDPGPDDGWSGHTPGVGAFVERDAQLRAEVARRHPFRLKLLARVENLPFVLHHEVIRLALSRPDELLAATSDTFDVDVSNNEPDRAAIIADLVATLGVLKILTLVGLSTDRRFPAVRLLTLLYALVILQLPPAAAQSVPRESPSRATRPPGQFVIAEPRMARAPGRLHPSLSITVEGASGCARRGGAL